MSSQQNKGNDRAQRREDSGSGSNQYEKYVKNKNKADKSKATSKGKIELSIPDIIRCMTFPQPIAAIMLDVSVSTLKRRFYELQCGRWPIHSNNSEHGIEYLGSQNILAEDKARIRTITNDKNVDEKNLDYLTCRVLQCAFANNTILK
ncbi:RKD2 [Acrasis kona]|uniref:RKD2 n=1 Tax=Acrasis kona TaxID=1008807 RepID=A0AAW2YJR3_9EUKA